MKITRTAALLGALSLPLHTTAQVPVPPDTSGLSKAYPGAAYSPYAGRNFATGVYWGDTHLHTDISMDAGAFGNRLGLTPSLDALADQSLFFTRMLATGTRTVRGLEAVTLSVPPTPGQSILRRPGKLSI